MPKRQRASAAAVDDKNPLKDAKKIAAAMEIVAQRFVDEVANGKASGANGKSFRSCDFAQAVLKEMGFPNFAHNDTGCRVRLHKPEPKEAAFIKAGVDTRKIYVKKGGKDKYCLEWLVKHELPEPAANAVLPPLPSGGDVPSNQSSVPSAIDLAARLAKISLADLEARGAILVRSLLTPQQARECLLALGQKGALGKEEEMRPTVGHGVNGSYSKVQQMPPALTAACDALRAWLTPPPDTDKTKSLLLRYGAGGVNWAHQDQADSPWQAVMLLNPPSEYGGGAFYVTDAAKQPLAPLEVPFTCEGDVVIFAANSNEPRGRHLYHGMTEVTWGQRFAFGMFQ